MSTEPIELLIADVDGTLVTHDKELTPEAIEAADALRRAGVRLAITSGRPPRGMRMLVEPLRIDQPLAGFNGGVFTEPDLRVIEERPLPPEIAREALRLVLDGGLDAWVYTRKDWLIRDPDAAHVAREAFTVRFDAMRVEDFTDAQLDDAVKIVGVSDDHDKVRAAETRAQETLGPRASATRSQPYYLDVTHADANKGAVVRSFARRLGIPAARIATIGDSANDTLMFREAGFSIAMGNAHDDVKRQADAVAAGNEENGFADAVRRLILPRAARSAA